MYHAFSTKNLGADWERAILKLSTFVINIASHLSLISEVRYHHSQLTSNPRSLKDHSVVVTSQSSKVPDPSEHRSTSFTEDRHLCVSSSHSSFNLSVLSTNLERNYSKARFTWSTGTALLIFAEMNITYRYVF